VKHRRFYGFDACDEEFTVLADAIRRAREMIENGEEWHIDINRYRYDPAARHSPPSTEIDEEMASVFIKAEVIFTDAGKDADDELRGEWRR